ncbi:MULTISPECIES: flavodoxin [Clostridium]|uniref:Flavodoxin n=2 Tax=Clostridium TaxID=1485 RepID=A0A6V8SJL9_9CLOT|nr:MULTISPECIES: flavodoxin [Clostridium]GFP77140.1 Flavodoxin [Clostridium fungisolvens]GKU23536.1 flavodoxin [Clostridium folliculivorans]GKU29652.1 flavodoxin [Clostridium folliculivorans]
MKKVSIIYWSNGGNVEVLADAIAASAKENGAQVMIKHVTDATVDDVINADSVAFGSPSMDSNRIEQQEMEPYINQFKLLPNNGKKLILFGSYGWDEGQFIIDWSDRMKDYGFNVVDILAVKESPSEEQLRKARELGKELAR